MFLLRLFNASTWPNPATAAFARTNMLATTSTGLLISTTVLFFLQASDIETQGITQAASLGTFLGVLVIPFVGRLARRWTATRIYTITLLIQGLTLLSWQAATHHLAAMCALIASSLCAAAISATVGSFITELGIPSTTMANTRAGLRTITNIGIGTGGLVAAVLFRLGAHGPRIAVALAALCTLGAFLTVLTGPHASNRRPTQTAPTTTPRGTHQDPPPAPRSPYRDGRYLALALTNGVLSTHTAVLTYGLPAMLALSATIGDWMIGVCTAINAIAVVFFQLPTTTAAGRLPRSTVTMIAAGATVTMALIFAASTQLHMSTPLAVLLNVAGVIALTLGELWQSSAEFDISYAAAPENNHQEYQAAYALGHNIARTAAPISLGWVILAGGTGWLILALIYAVCGAIHTLGARTITTD